MTLCQLLAHQPHLHFEAGTPALLLFMLSLLKIEVRVGGVDFMPQCLSYLGSDKLLRRLHNFKADKNAQMFSISINIKNKYGGPTANRYNRRLTS